ncbi:hypothetical protein NECAME_02326 [Necator americanus]|uniref:Uncharacterized protein n=1 Tax=Necator americanus TaxID=51031 RepID=W2TG50_NECAM|nr:hypothetical protein NECAME_02326 [Necator americanus]ETN80579.1 hypothetical protein NECAME_02326 [Necator americanus]
MYDMIHAIEEASAAAEIGEVSRLRPFVGCPSSTFRRLMKVAIRNVGDSVNAMDVIEAILIWATENVENDLVVSLLQQIPIDDLSTDEMDMLSEFAIDCGLGRLMTVVTNRFYALNTSSLSQRLDFEESENLEGYVEEQKAVREDRNGKRIAAGKNVTSTRTTQDKTEVKEEPAGIRIIATPEDRQYIRKIMEKTEAVYFGAVPLEKSNNDLHIEITYQGPKEAAKDDPVKLYFDFEIDPPVTVS